MDCVLRLSEPEAMRLWYLSRKWIVRAYLVILPCLWWQGVSQPQAQAITWQVATVWLDRKSTRLNSSHSQINKYTFFFNDTATTEIYTLSLHDALPIW